MNIRYIVAFSLIVNGLMLVSCGQVLNSGPTGIKEMPRDPTQLGKVDKDGWIYLAPGVKCEDALHYAFGFEPDTTAPSGWKKQAPKTEQKSDDKDEVKSDQNVDAGPSKEKKK